MEQKNTHTAKVSVLFVCMANICRSPTAHGVFDDMVDAANLSGLIHVDSAGVRSKDRNKEPDPRAQAVALQADYNLSTLRSRRTKVNDYQLFDYILAADEGVLDRLKEEQPEDSDSRVQLLLDYATNIDAKDIPDPYYGRISDFELALHYVEESCLGLLEHIIANHLVVDTTNDAEFVTSHSKTMDNT